MYAWYQKAGVCYTYLPDVVLVEGEGGNWEETRAQFRRSAWFTRGWTLQELLAPPVVIFFDRGWKLVGSKEDNSSKGRSLHSDISGATGISKHELTNAGAVCVAKKFS